MAQPVCKTGIRKGITMYAWQLEQLQECGVTTADSKQEAACGVQAAYTNGMVCKAYVALCGGFVIEVVFCLKGNVQC